MPNALIGTLLRLLSKIMLLTLCALVLGGCSHAGNYFEFWKIERTKKKEFSIEPTAKLLRELQPGDSFLLAGPVNQKTNYRGPVLLVAVTDMFKKREIVAERILQTPVLYYQAYLPEGNYDLYFFADLNGNGYFDANEMIGQTSGAPIHVRKKEVQDGMTFKGPVLTLDVNSPATTSLPIKVRVRDQEYVFRSLDDQFFDPQYGEIGMYDPKKLFTHTQRFVFALEKINSNKTMVIFVHGVAGTPRDFKYLVDGLDRTRYQPLFYFYPSGMPLQKLGSLLSDIMIVLTQDKQFHIKRVIVVAHSMGGLVGLCALNELCLNGAPAYLKGYISFNTPYGGVESAKKAVESAPAVLAAWRDVAPGSSFLERLYQGSAAGKI
ncbi:MAG: alpha/beta hydrolase, partial [Syntrophaceae bacterium]|nr:alpha/beta hydrolase [Syntrophaceae bacterium]